MTEQVPGFERIILETLNELKSSISELKRNYEKQFEKSNDRFDSIKTELYKELTIVRIDIAQNRLKNSMLGVVSGLIPIAIMLMLKFFFNM